MIRLTDINYRVVLIAPSAIACVTQAGASQGWHGIQANVQKFDKSWIEVRESVDTIQAAIEAAS